mmetsp:Transcript_3869/g.7417  ORF Transcript_3869/g.7417 Transcript_3869/m.7417 type:complete len:2553 (+) Transcript_3869:270-7928(+)
MSSQAQNHESSSPDPKRLKVALADTTTTTTTTHNTKENSRSLSRHLPPPPPPPAQAPAAAPIYNSSFSRQKHRSRSMSPHHNHNHNHNSWNPFVQKQTQKQKQKHRRTLTKREKQLLQDHAQHKFDFQSPLLLYTQRTLDVRTRMAFEKKSIGIVKQELMNAAKDMAHRDGYSSQMAISHKLRKLSPSLEHLQLLERMEEIRYTRQLCWSPAVSPHADPFYGWDDDYDIDEGVGEIEGEGNHGEEVSKVDKSTRRKMLLTKKRRESSMKRHGKYRRMDPLEYVQKVLPPHEPLLSNIKRRLPMRSDVGFPGATEEEIRIKQEEIAKEAHLEEISPRLIVLLNSDDLACISDDGNGNGNDDHIASSSVDDIAKEPGFDNEWSLPGMPYASDILHVAKQCPSVVMTEEAKKRKSTKKKRYGPDVYSIFAPPLDSTSSSTSIWRPPPFVDRPVGMVRALVIPLDVSFGIGNVEPLVCTLSLYCLPPIKNKQGNESQSLVRGKISEDFIFPAGNWKNMLEEKSGKRLAEEFGIKDMASGGKKTLKKALFSYDSSILPSSNDSVGMDSIYLFMQVHKVLQMDAEDAYLDGTNDTASTQFMNFTKRGSFTKRDDAATIQRAKQTFDTYGTQFMTPFCFGILPLFPTPTNNDDIHWPQGVVQNMQLFSNQLSNENEHNFIQCLSSLAEVIDTNHAFPHRVEQSGGILETVSIDSQSTYDSIQRGDSSDSKAKKPKRFRLRFHRKAKLPPLSNDLGVDVSKLKSLKVIDGGASFYTSLIGSDFSQALLQSPQFLEKVSSNRSPRLFVDSSGDCAIMLKPTYSQSSSTKRSNLIRLPPSISLSGYSDSSEIREVMFLPPRASNIAPMIPFDHGVHCNFLYLYPLKITTDKENMTTKNGQRYSVRIRVVRKVSDNSNKENNHRGESLIYNPSLLGEPVVEAVYTRIPSSCTSKNTHDYFLRDEIKLRLPYILDGSYFIEFCLYSIEFISDSKNDGEILKQKQIAESLIPLSSNASRDASTTSKIYTVIPDGVHRIKLADCQLEIHSKMFSRVHVNDPSVAIVLRDFSQASFENFEKSPIEYSIALRNASQDTISRHFQCLLFAHFKYLLSNGKFIVDFSKGEVVKSDVTLALIETFKCLVELITRFKKSCLDKGASKKILKFICDSFDDYHYRKGDCRISSSSRSMLSENSDDSFDSMMFSDAVDEATFQSYEQKVATYQKELSNPSNLSHLSSRVSYGHRGVKIRQTYSNLKYAAPLDRRAYGASKIDRMKAEAELYESNQVLNELLDDDETVVTAITLQSQARLLSSNMSVGTTLPVGKEQIGKILRSKPSVHQNKQNLVVNKNDPGTVVEENHAKIIFSVENPFEKAKEIAKRVNIVAKGFVAPCVTPGQNMPFAERLDVPKKLENLMERDSRIQSLRVQCNQHVRHVDSLMYAGSEDEYAQYSRDTLKKHSILLLPNIPNKAPLRGITDTDLFHVYWSLPVSQLKSDGEGPYIYEIIFSFWLHSFSTGLKNPNSANESITIDPRLCFQSFDFLLPLCLKSLALRCSENKNVELVSATILDMNHLKILDPLVAHIALSLMLDVVDYQDEKFNQRLAQILIKSDAILDFFTGLLSIIHPAQTAFLIMRYLRTLKDCEEYSNHTDHDQTSYNYVKRLIVCKQLRLHAVERLSVIPRFAALNYPFKYNDGVKGKMSEASSWINQSISQNSGGGLENKHHEIPSLTDQAQPERHWLADLLLEECFDICIYSCEAAISGTVNEAKGGAISKKTKKQSSMRQKTALNSKDIERQYSISLHAITIAYENILRRHAMSIQFQSRQTLHRIAGMFLSTVIKKTVEAIYFLAKLQPNSKVRLTWLCCLTYVLQEAPEVLLKKYMLSLCDITEAFSKDTESLKFLNALKLCIPSFQCLASDHITPRMSPWLIQESFNTVSAASIVLVDECCDVLVSRSTFHAKNLTEGVLELLLQIISSPLSSVTLLRGLGAVSHVLDKVGAGLFLSAVGDHLQNFARMLLTLMNSISLSVRSMSVDLTISLFGSIYKEVGNIDEVSQIFVTVLPEVVSREVALYSMSKQIASSECIERCMWPLRRALADIDGSDPLDDDRVDVNLQLFLRQFCRVSQAVIDGVFIELRLLDDECMIVGTKINMTMGATRTARFGRKIPFSSTFDADEESLFEVADFFSPETSPMQKLRWLMTLKRLHEYKEQFVEAAETLILCARTIADAIPHLKNIWRASFYREWKKMKDVAEFTDEFLEPSFLKNALDTESHDTIFLTLPQPSISSLGKILISVTEDAILFYEKESRTVALAYSRLQEVFRIMTASVEHVVSSPLKYALRTHQHHIQEIAALRKVSATVNEMVTKLAERMRLQSDDIHSISPFANLVASQERSHPGLVYVRVALFGIKPRRFLESTTIPTFLGWEEPFICRVSEDTVLRALKHVPGKDSQNEIALLSQICKLHAELLISSIKEDTKSVSVEFAYAIPDESVLRDSDKLFLVVTPVVAAETIAHNTIQSKRFYIKKKMVLSQNVERVTNISVAKSFPCALSRQPCLVTTELATNSSFF